MFSRKMRCLESRVFLQIGDFETPTLALEPPAPDADGWFGHKCVLTKIDFLFNSKYGVLEGL